VCALPWVASSVGSAARSVQCGFEGCDSQHHKYYSLTSQKTPSKCALNAQVLDKEEVDEEEEEQEDDVEEFVEGDEEVRGGGCGYGCVVCS